MKRIRAQYHQAKQAKIKADECYNCACMALSPGKEKDLVLARHYLTEKERLLRLQSQHLSEISNCKNLSETLMTASRNLELSRQLSSASLTLDDLLKAMPKDAEIIIDKINEQMSDVQHQTSVLTEEPTTTAAGGSGNNIDDEIELIMAQELPSVPATTKGKEEVVIKKEQEEFLL